MKCYNDTHGMISTHLLIYYIVFYRKMGVNNDLKYPFLLPKQTPLLQVLTVYYSNAIPVDDK